MSVNTSEEYLDELLEAIEPIIRLEEPQPPVMPVVEEAVVQDTTMEEVATETIVEAQESEIPEENYAQEPSVSELLAAMADDEGDFMDETAVSEEDVESMLNAVSMQTATEETGAYDEDVKELLKQFSDDEDLSDIQDILDKNDNGEALDNSMLELPDVEVFQLVEENDNEDNEAAKIKSNPIGKLIGGFSALFKKRKNKKEKSKQEEPVPEDNAVSMEEESVEPDYESISDTGLELADIDSMDFEELLGEDVEDLVFDEDMSDIEQLLTGGAFAETEDVQEEDTDKAVKEKISGKKVKEKKNKKHTKKEKKESLFTKVLNALTEEMDEPVKAGNGVPEAGETGVTEENLEILKELSAEDRKKAKKAAKEERKNKKAEKSGKKSSRNAEGDEEDNGKEDDKKAKKDKKPKKKREKKKKPRKVEEITKPEKKLPKKRVRSIFVLCFSILAAVLILQSVVSKSDNLKEAKNAFNNGDYATCFANLETVDRSEEEEDLYQKSFIIMSVQRKWDAYNNFAAMGNRLEALNSLLEGVAEYRSWEETALEYGVHAQITVIYQDMLDALLGYGLSQSDVDEILAYESKVTYTKRLDSIVNGTPFVMEEMSEDNSVSEPQPLQDVLPGEEDFLPDDNILTDDTVIMEDIIIEEDSDVQNLLSTGETVVVGSNPTDISAQEDSISYEEPIDVGGQNVGTGSTNISSEVNGNNVLIGVR